MKGHAVESAKGRSGGKTALQVDRTVCAGGGCGAQHSRIHAQCGWMLDAGRSMALLLGRHTAPISAPCCSHHTQRDHYSTRNQETQAERQSAVSLHLELSLWWL